MNNSSDRPLLSAPDRARFLYYGKRATVARELIRAAVQAQLMAMDAPAALTSQTACAEFTEYVLSLPAVRDLICKTEKG